MKTAYEGPTPVTLGAEPAPTPDRHVHLSTSHPLAGVAAAHCWEHLGNARRSGLGRVACGACWERAIRDDERFAVECGLPREVVPDPDYVDEVAVERACAGGRVRLTPAELVVAVERLRAAGYGLGAIARRLHKAGRDVVAAWQVIAEREATAVAAERGEAA